MKLVPLVLALAFAGSLHAQSSSDEAAIRNIVANETASWNTGDAVGYSRDFAEAGTLTNIRGQFFTGYAAFLKIHEVIFDGMFKNTTLSQDVVSLTFLRPDIATVDVLTSVAGIAPGTPGMARDDKGRLRTRLLQVIAKQDGAWKIVSYHNVDVKPGVAVPEPGVR